MGNGPLREVAVTQRTFFTADLHLFHKRICEVATRPWGDVQEMHEALIQSWNTVVSSQDRVFVLGDLSFAGSTETMGVTHRLNGTLYLIRGNHCPKSGTPANFGWAKDYHTETIDGEYVVMSHFPMLAWNRQHYGSWMLHGHCHGSLTLPQEMRGARIFDVGVDNVARYGLGYRPVTLEEIKEMAGEVRTVTLDHHKERNNGN